jgi:hypothetical protein
MHADRSAQRDGSSYTTILSKNLLFIREHSRKSVVMLFSEYLKETAYRGLTQIHADRSV